MYSVVIVDRHGNVVRSSHKWARATELEANKLRNQLQAFWDKFFPNVEYHAKVRHHQEANKNYYVYNGIGLLMGEYEEKEAKELLEIHEDWTLTEVK